jgi:hypothetical protein
MTQKQDIIWAASQPEDDLPEELMKEWLTINFLNFLKTTPGNRYEN